MLQRFLTSTLLLIGLTLSGPSMAQDEPSTILDYAMAERAMAAALEEARDNGWNLTIVIADHNGLPLSLIHI